MRAHFGNGEQKKGFCISFSQCNPCMIALRSDVFLFPSVCFSNFFSLPFALVPCSPFVRLFSHSARLHCGTGMCIFRFAMKIIITQFSYLYEKWLFLDRFAVGIALSSSLSLVGGAAPRCTRALAPCFGGFLQSRALSLPLRLRFTALDVLSSFLASDARELASNANFFRTKIGKGKNACESLMT